MVTSQVGGRDVVWNEECWLYVDTAEVVPMPVTLDRSDIMALGVIVRDKATGYKGRVTGIHLSVGCNQREVSRVAESTGHLQERWLTIERLELVKATEEAAGVQ